MKHALDEQKVEKIGRDMLVVLQDCLCGLAHMHDNSLSLGAVPLRGALGLTKRADKWRGVLCDFAHVAKCAPALSNPCARRARFARFLQPMRVLPGLTATTDRVSSKTAWARAPA